MSCTGGSATINTGAGPGNLDLAQPSQVTTTDTSPLFAAAVYRGEQATGPGQTYWNVALGLAAGASDCHLTTTGTATSSAFTDLTTPSGTTWPLITWDAALTAAGGALICTSYPLDGADCPDRGVCTGYTAIDAPVTLDHGSDDPGGPPDLCPDDPAKLDPGTCGCGFIDSDPCSYEVTVELYDSLGAPLTTFAYDATGAHTTTAATYVSGTTTGPVGWVSTPYVATMPKVAANRTFFGRILGLSRAGTVNLALLTPTTMATVNATTGAVSYGPSPGPGARVRFVFELMPVTVELYDPGGAELDSVVYDHAGHLSDKGTVYIYHPQADVGFVPVPFWTTFALGTGTRAFVPRYLGHRPSFNIDVAQLAPDVMATVDVTIGQVTYGPSATGARVRFVYDVFTVTVENHTSGGAPAGGTVYVYHPLGDSGWQPSPFWTTFSRGQPARAFVGHVAVSVIASVDVGALWPDVMATIDPAATVSYGSSPSADARVRVVHAP